MNQLNMINLNLSSFNNKMNKKLMIIFKIQNKN